MVVINITEYTGCLLLARLFVLCHNAPISKLLRHMEHPKLLAALQANVDNYWREIEIGDFDQLLADLVRGKRITAARRQSLILELALRRIPLYEKDREAADASPLRP